MKKKILVLTSTFPRWQNDTDPPFVYELSRRLVREFEVYVLTPQYAGAYAREVMDGVNVIRFRYFIRRFEKLAGHRGILTKLKINKAYYLLVPFFLVFQFVAVLRATKKLQPDIIHAHWIIPQGFIATLVTLIYPKIPVIVTTHGGDLSGMQSLFMRKVKQVILARATKVTAVSVALKNECEKILGKVSRDIAVIPMGVDSSQFRPSSDKSGLKKKLFGRSGQALLFVGRLTEKKGLLYLIHALPTIFEEFPETFLVVIGDGDQREFLESEIFRMGISKKVIMFGAIPNENLPKYYAASDIFISTSFEEGFGLTFVEAGMSGCIVVGTEVGGIKDIIEPNVTGFFVRKKDACSIASVVTEILSGSLGEGVGRQAIEIFRQSYDWQVIAEKYRRLLRE